MKNDKPKWLPLVLIALIVFTIIGIVKHFHVKNFHVIEADKLYTSGQPRGMDYTRLLYKYHIGTFVNVRSADEHREQNWYNEEITWVRNNGVKYVELPVERHNPIPDAKTRKMFLELMDDKTNLPILVHGSSGRKRVSMLAAVWMIKEKGFTAEEAIKAAEQIQEKNIRDEQKKFIFNLAAKQQHSEVLAWKR